MSEQFEWNYSWNEAKLYLFNFLRGLLAKDAETYFNYLSFGNVRYDQGEQPMVFTEIVGPGLLRYFFDPMFVQNKSVEELAKWYYNNVTSFEHLLSTLWQSGFPCFSQLGIFSKVRPPMLRKCKWKGIEIPCESIFSKSVTDIGICCSFNKDKADEIYVESIYSRTIEKLQQHEKLISPTKGNIPDWYTTKDEPKTMSGIDKGLYLMIDSNTDNLEDYSINSDFVSQTIIIGSTGKLCEHEFVFVEKIFDF